MLLRRQALAVLLSVAGPFAGTVAVAIAEPLDKESCANLQVERKKLLTREMQAALEHGPDWVKDHLDDKSIGKVRRFLSVEEQIVFRCRGGGVAKVPAKATETPPGKGPRIPEPCRSRTAIRPGRLRHKATTGSLAKRWRIRIRHRLANRRLPR